jgi:hypothetical protein
MNKNQLQETACKGIMFQNIWRENVKEIKKNSRASLKKTSISPTFHDC